MIDNSKLTFNSNQRYQYIALKGNVSFSLSGGGYSSTTVTIPHNLGYRPYVKSKYTYGSGKYFQLSADPNSYDIDGNATQISNEYADASNYVVFIESFAAGAVTGTIYYRIYAEPQT